MSVVQRANGAPFNDIVVQTITAPTALVHEATIAGVFDQHGATGLTGAFSRTGRIRENA